MRVNQRQSQRLGSIYFPAETSSYKATKLQAKISLVSAVLSQFFFARQLHCNSLDAEKVTDELQRYELNATAWLISDTGKYGHGLSQLLHEDKYRLDAPQRVLEACGG